MYNTENPENLSEMFFRFLEKLLQLNIVLSVKTYK